MILDEELRKEYATLFNEMSYTYNVYISEYIVNKIIKRIENFYILYVEAQKLSNVPWYFIACLHSMESNLDFTKHLHNGDPLANKTINHPKGRPEGKPPFSWLHSVVDALKYKKLDQWDDWTIEGMFFKLEEYNGFGYRKYHSHVKSPYLWSGTNHYKSGKYVADGKWSETAISKQVGSAIILKELLIMEKKKQSNIELNSEEAKIDSTAGRIITIIFIVLFISLLVIGFYFKD